jgi:hypothetical protein
MFCASPKSGWQLSLQSPLPHSWFVPSTAAVAAEPAASQQTDAAVTTLRERLRSFDVAPDVQERLAAKFLVGEALDADTDATPVSSATKTVNGTEVTRHVYADGSVALGRIENPKTP